MKHFDKNLGVNLKNNDIVVWKDIFLRRNIYISQKFPENYLVKIQEFLCYHTKARRKYNFELNPISMIDETRL